MVFNDSKVRKARLVAADGDREFECLLLHPLNGKKTRWEVMMPKSRKRKTGSRYDFRGGASGTIDADLGGGMKSVSFDAAVDDRYLEVHGHVPLPPYIKRKDTDFDSDRYQTVYSSAYGSSAAPTAGLHFTQEILSRLKERGIELRFVTLHVGLGTFLPIRSENVEDHVMHSEDYSIPASTSSAVTAAMAQGRPVVAVGTTTVRTLESAWTGDGFLESGSTSMFIRPGYRFEVVDTLFTNFHTPGSTLLLLVGAFAGMERIRAAYAEAVRERYRFFSYGDAMLIV